jgi:hypothetical protein
MTKIACIGSLIAVLGLGCGGGGDGGGVSEGPSVPKGTVNVMALGTSGAQADSLNKALVAGKGEAVAGSALSLSNAGMGAVTPGGAQALMVAQALSTINADAPGVTGTQTCTATGCVYDKFGNGGFTMTGSVTWTDVAGAKKVVWNLDGTLDQTSTGAVNVNGGATDIKFVYNWKGDITVSATSIVGSAGGTWNGSGMQAGQSFTFNYGSLIKFDAVVLTAGCVSGGTITAKWWVVANAGGQSNTQGAEGSHVFTACMK